jgi:glycosyltransferase involved in cell wall biosynthesis
MSADISVIIPARDRLWALPKAVASCRSERLAVQIIVIDDASADGTAEWLKSQADIEIVAGEGWGKPAGIARALPLANGKYLRYLDSDDWLNEGTNELQFDIAERENADVVVAGLDYYEDDVLTHTQPWQESDDFIAKMLGEGEGSAYSSFLFRRSFVVDIPHRTLFAAANFASRDDRCYLLEVALRHPRIAVSPKPALCLRHHKQPRLQFRRRLASIGTFIQEIHIYRQILRMLQERNELTPRRIRAAINILWRLAHRLAAADLDEGCDIAAWVYRLDPKFRPPERGVLGWLYRTLGFRATERLLNVRRAAVDMVRR